MLDRILSRVGVSFILMLCFLPIYFPIMARYEGVWFPVVTNVVLVDEQSGNEPGFSYVDIYVNFTKSRQCRFVNLSWYDEFDRRLVVDFEPDVSVVTSRPVGDQATGPWRINGILLLAGSRAVVEHACHPGFNTYAQFYP